MDKEQIELSVTVIVKAIGQIPCFHVYEEHVAGRFGTTEPEIALQAMMHNAALDSTLISLRCFNEFFRSGGRRDDVRAHHFPGVSMAPFLEPDDHQAIDKYLAHITLSRLDIVTKPWFLDEMTFHGLQHAIKFLSILDAGFPLHSESATNELRGILEIARRLIPKIEKFLKPQESNQATQRTAPRSDA